MGFNIENAQFNRVNDISNGFVSAQRGDTVYDYIENMESIQVFTYVALIVLVLYVFQFIPLTLTHLGAIGLAMLIIFYFNMKDKRKYETKMNDLYFKLHLISPKPTYFYMDSDIIELIDDIKEYREYNLVSWSHMIYSLDNFLEIVHDFEIGVKDKGDNLDIMKHQKQLAVDHLQAILFKLPVSRPIEYKLERAIYYMNLILQRHIDNIMHEIEKDIKENGYNTKTKIFYFDEIKGKDPEKYREYYNYN